MFFCRPTGPAIRMAQASLNPSTPARFFSAPEAASLFMNNGSDMFSIQCIPDQFRMVEGIYDLEFFQTF